MNLISPFRLLFICGSLISALILSFAYILEYKFNLVPCPLCLLQRYALWAIFCAFIIGAIYNGKTIARTLYCISIFLFSIIGIILSSRHVWLQYFAPPGVANCMAELGRMLQFKPFLQVLKEILLQSSAECTRIDFTFLKLSLPAWSLLSFIVFAIFSVLVGWRQTKRRI